MEYKRRKSDDAIYVEHNVEDHIVTLRAENLRHTATGLHADVSILYTEPETHKRYALESNEFNVKRMEQRTKLSRAAHSMIHNGFKSIYPENKLRALLKVFCDGLSDFDSNDLAPEEVMGNPDYSPTWLLKPFLLQGGGTILYAPGGSTKSYTAMLMAVSVHNGISKRHGGIWDVFQTPTLYINMERSPESLRGRLGWVNQCLNLDGDSPIYMFNIRGRPLSSVKHNLARFIEYHQIGFVILDSLSRTGVDDLNENAPSRMIMDMMNDLVPSWLALGHTPANNPKKIFGSTQFTYAADITVMMNSQRKGNSTGSSYQLIKGNDVDAPPKSYLAFDFRNDKLTRVRVPQANEFEDLNEEKLTPQQQVINYLYEVSQAPVKEMVSELGVNANTLTSLLRRGRTEHFVHLPNGNWALLTHQEEERSW